MKRFLSLFVFILLALQCVNGQVHLKNSSDVTGFDIIPGESVYIHFNSTILLTGEYLFYKVYCFNKETNYLSDLSKVAYVELVGKEGNVLFQHKVKLENGKGHGDFFIPTSARTGNYKLVAYTHWMKNQPMNSFFQNDMYIINPYQTNNSETSIYSDSLTVEDKLVQQTQRDQLKIFDAPLEVIIKEQDFNKRSLVSLVIKKTGGNASQIGDISVSVRKKGFDLEPLKTNLKQYFEQFGSKSFDRNESVGSLVYLPELRGELLSGKVSSKNKDLTVGKLKIAVSIPGESYFFDIAQTDEQGDFYVNINEYYSGHEIFLQVLGEKRSEFTIQMNDHFSLDYSQLEFNDFSIYPEMKEEIIHRSVHNQIESAYFQFKKDSILQPVIINFFDTATTQTYILDEFTRFPTVRETIVEIIKNVGLKRIDNENEIIIVKGYNSQADLKTLPLIIVDGNILQNHNELLDYNAHNISKISVQRNQFAIGPQIFKGAIEFKTKSKNYEGIRNDTTVFVTYLLEPQRHKNYYKQLYENTDQLNRYSRLPDDRVQLLWIPKLKIDKNETPIDFYTSDIVGDFEIYIEGISQDGLPISISKFISVK